METAKELLNYSSSIYTHIQKLSQIGAISNDKLDEVCEQLKNIRGILAQSVLSEENNIDLIRKDSLGYFPLRKINE